MNDTHTFVDLLQKHSQHRPDKVAYRFLDDGETETTYLTYQILDQQARLIAAYLQRQIAPGERALLIYPPGPSFITAFLGCLCAGIVAVPVFPPRRNRPDDRLAAIAADAKATCLLSTTSIIAEAAHRTSQTSDLANLHWLGTDQLPVGDEALWQMPNLNTDTLAFLQYTSGSTGKPKGVMVSHSNLMANQAMIKTAFGHTEETVVVGWLPLFHDMGLIGNALQPLYLGVSCILMPPLAFLQQPFRWLQAISSYKATTSGGPNFAYDLCAQKITPEQRATLDLSSWEVAFNGSEPIRAETLDRFVKAFAPCGFRREAFYPCYGLAEATLLVSGGLKTAPPITQTVDETTFEQNRVMPNGKQGLQTQGRTLIGCGQPQSGEQVVIVNPESCIQCQAGQVGEIWVSGSNVAQGYWNQPQETNDTFQATIADTGAGPFLRTGDLGFIDDGELFVTGRLKDVIIIRGHNHYPQDIELTVQQSHPALRPGCGAAFSVEIKDEERLVIVQEVTRVGLRQLDVADVTRTIRQAVTQNHQIQVYSILLLKPGGLPKTSSGKIQRHACRAGFQANTLPTVDTVTRREPKADRIADLVAVLE